MKSLTSADLSCVEHTELVVKEMERQIEAAHEATKGNHKTTKVNVTVLVMKFFFLNIL